VGIPPIETGKLNIYSSQYPDYSSLGQIESPSFLPFLQKFPVKPKGDPWSLHLGNFWSSSRGFVSPFLEATRAAPLTLLG